MRNKGLFQPLVLAAILALGFGLVWGLTGGWILETTERASSTAREQVNLVFLADGTLLLRHSTNQYPYRQHYTDLDGKPVLSPADEVLREHAWSGPFAPAMWTPRGLPAHSWQQRIRAFTDGREFPIYWYFISDGRINGKGYFVGYDTKSKLCVGYLGKTGFREGAVPPDELIPVNGNASRHSVFGGRTDFYFQTAHPDRYGGAVVSRPPPQAGAVAFWDVYVVGREGTIYHADLQKRTVQQILEDPELCSANVVAAPTDPVRGTLRRLAVRTGNTIQVLDVGGQVLTRYPIPQGLQERSLNFMLSTSGEGVMSCSSSVDEWTRTVDYDIYWVALDGRFREKNITLPSGRGQQWSEKCAGLIIPVPLLLDGAIGIVGPLVLMDEGRAATFQEAQYTLLAAFWPSLVMAQLIAVFFAGLCYRRQVRYGADRRERLAWALFVLLFGLPAWIGYRFGRSWPVLESCPVCHVRVPRDRDICSRCAAAFPPPSLKGTELFA